MNWREWRGKPPEERRAAVARYKAASAELERVSRHDREETEAYHAANDELWAACEAVPWWRRW